jgi:hypothetical protein
MKLILIDNRINNIPDWISSFNYNVHHIIFDFYKDTFGTLYSKIEQIYITNQSQPITDILLLQDSWDLESLHILSKTQQLDICPCTCLNHSWTDIILFLNAIKSTFGIERFDFYEYMLYLNQDTRNIMNLLHTETDINFLSSWNFKGKLGSVWIEKSYNAYIRYLYIHPDITLQQFIILSQNIRADIVSIEVPNLEDGELYEFMVEAVSDQDKYIAECRELGLTTPDKPTIAIATINKSYFLILIDKIPFVEQFILYKSTDGINFTAVDYTITNYFKDFDYIINVPYYFKVVAVNNSGRSEFSDIVIKMIDGNPTLMSEDKSRLELLIDDTVTVNKERITTELQETFINVIEELYTPIYLTNSTVGAIVNIKYINGVFENNLPILKDSLYNIILDKIDYSKKEESLNMTVSGIFVNIIPKTENLLQLSIKLINSDGITSTSIINNTDTYIHIYFRSIFDKVNIFKYVNGKYTKMITINSSLNGIENVNGLFETTGRFIKKEIIDDIELYSYTYFGPFSNIIISNIDEIEFNSFENSNDPNQAPKLYKRPDQTYAGYIEKERNRMTLYEFRRAYDAGPQQRKMRFLSHLDRLKYLEGGIFSN